MKSFSKKPDPEIEQDEEDVEIDDAGPKIAAGKKGKMLIVLASAALITGVVYTMFFKDEPAKQERLQEVQIVPEKVTIAPSEDGKSPFEIEQPTEKPKDKDQAIFDQPAAPAVPTLPELPKDSVAADVAPLVPQDSTPPVATITTDPNLQQQTQQQPQPQQPVIPLQNQQANNDVAPKKEEDEGIDPRYAPIVVLQGGTGPASSVGYDQNIVSLKKNPLDALTRNTSDIPTTYIDDRTHTIAQGKLITAVMETAINTEIPGFVRAIVSRDVYGEAGNNVLIPRGSRLFGTYSSQITRGQGRVNISWTRLIRPDGVNLAISFNASDQFGRSGISGDVDNRYGNMFASSILTSILAVGGAIAAEKLSGSNTNSTTTTNPTQGTVTTSNKASNQIIYDVTKTIIDTVGTMAANTLNTSPVIRVPQGTRITVFVNSDIKAPYIQ